MSQVYPVIHYDNDELTIEQAILAKSLGADGVFLISHKGSNERLAPLAKEIKDRFPGFNVGLNLLGASIMDTAKLAEKYNLDMIWGDFCGVSSKGLDKEGILLSMWAKDHPIDVFASVAFKYQRVESNPALAAKEAMNAGFIPTTSGSGTGSAPTGAKVGSMSEATNGLLAIASGMTCDNIRSFAPYLSHILVAAGISMDENRFDIDKLGNFIKIVKSIVA
jgi:predicted TIM-barrel enzyme